MFKLLSVLNGKVATGPVLVPCAPNMARLYLQVLCLVKSYVQNFGGPKSLFEACYPGGHLEQSLFNECYHSLGFWAGQV